MIASFVFFPDIFLIYDYISTQASFTLSVLPPMKDSIYSKSGKKAGILSVLCNKSLQTYVRVCTYGLCMHTLQQEWLSHQLSQDSMVLVQDLSCSFPLCGASEIISYVLPNSSN